MSAGDDEGRVLARVSSETVRSATGLGWPEWLDALDAAGAAAMTHRGIVAHLAEAHPHVSSWWQQSIAVGYEQARGKRAVGETAGGFEVGVRRTVPGTPARVWSLLAAHPELWLGDGAALALEPGERYEVPSRAEGSGASGEVRVVRPGRRVRMTWQPGGWAAPATLEVTLTPVTTGTTVAVQLQKLPDAEAREAVRAHWRAALARVAAAVDDWPA